MAGAGRGRPRDMRSDAIENADRSSRASPVAAAIANKCDLAVERRNSDSRQARQPQTAVKTPAPPQCRVSSQHDDVIASLFRLPRSNQGKANYSYWFCLDRAYLRENNISFSTILSRTPSSCAQYSTHVDFKCSVTSAGGKTRNLHHP